MGPVPATPENAAAPHRPPAAPFMLNVTVALALGVKPVIAYIAIEGSPVTEVSGVVTVTVGGPVIVTLVKPFALVAETLARIKLGLPVSVFKPVIVQVLPAVATADAVAVCAMFARAEFGMIAIRADASRNTPAP
jgi:hypothetical protein